VTEFIVDMLVDLPAFFVWLAVVSLLVRPFGVRLPLRPLSFAKLRSAVQTFTFSQYVVVVGILYFGCGMLIATTLSRYLEWKYWHGSSFTIEQFVRDFFQHVALGGVFFGVISSLGRSDK
jgi:hypothetical protein